MSTLFPCPCFAVSTLFPCSFGLFRVSAHFSRAHKSASARFFRVHRVFMSTLFPCPYTSIRTKMMGTLFQCPYFAVNTLFPCYLRLFRVSAHFSRAHKSGRAHIFRAHPENRPFVEQDLFPCPYASAVSTPFVSRRGRIPEGRGEGGGHRCAPTAESRRRHHRLRFLRHNRKTAPVRRSPRPVSRRRRPRHLRCLRHSRKRARHPARWIQTNCKRNGRE